MTALTLSTRERRTVAAGAAVMLCTLGAARGLPAWRAWDTAQRHAADAARRDLHEAELGIARAVAVRDSLRLRYARLDSLKLVLLQATTPDEGAAGLGALVSAAADDAGVQIASVQLRPDSAFTGGMARVVIRVNAVSDVAGLADLLLQLETGRTLLAIRELTVNQAEPSAPATKAEALHFELVVEALATASVPEAR